MVPCPGRAGQRLGVSLLGPYQVQHSLMKSFIAMKDLLSRWVEVKPVMEPTIESVVVFFKKLSRREGIPEEIIT